MELNQASASNSKSPTRPQAPCDPSSALLSIFPPITGPSLSPDSLATWLFLPGTHSYLRALAPAVSSAGRVFPRNLRAALPPLLSLLFQRHLLREAAAELPA